MNSMGFGILKTTVVESNGNCFSKALKFSAHSGLLSLMVKGFTRSIEYLAGSKTSKARIRLEMYLGKKNFSFQMLK